MSVPLLPVPGHSSCSITLRVMRNHPPVTQKPNFQPTLGLRTTHIRVRQRSSDGLLPHLRSSVQKEESFARTHQTSCNRRTAPPPPRQSRLQEKKRHRVNPGEAQQYGSERGSTAAISTCSILPLPTCVLPFLEHATLAGKDHRVPTLAVPSGCNALPPILEETPSNSGLS